jgi:UPF0176 protein
MPNAVSTETSSPIRNIAFYKFVPIPRPDAMRERFAALCRAHELKGTIIVATEGINAMLAGAPAACERFVNELRGLAELSDVHVKASECSEPPFKKLVVKVKPEIVTMRTGPLDLDSKTGERLAPETFRDWLRSGEEMVVIDTRNDYECRLGSFRGAINPETSAFHEFPDYAREHREALADRKIVMFCTGGIRCEKATRWMLRDGFEQVYQLDGGVLNYFERIEDAHADWDGELFVFDQRVAVDTTLAETPTTLCSECGAPIPAEQRACDCAGI